MIPEITLFTNDAAPLTKLIGLDVRGKPLSNGSACLMTRGWARRVPIDDINHLAQLIPGLKSNEAIALGTLRDDLPNSVRVTTKVKLNNFNGSAANDLIARTAGTIVYRPKEPAFVLLDYDAKGMPQAVADQLNQLGGFWPAIISVLPELKYAAHLIRNSTSAGLYRADTGEEFPGSGGLHVYVPIVDGGDADRFLKTLHQRCWLAGLGWMMVGAGGQLLERSIVDRMVGAPERLVFEGPPTLIPPLQQHQSPRLPIVTNGEVIDTAQICSPLTLVELSKLRELKAQEAHRLAGQRAAAREHFVAEHARSLAERTGMDLSQARSVIAKQCDGVLLPTVLLKFDDPELAVTTVADILADPGKYEGETLSDPLEGISYGSCMAKIMRRADGTPWINSFAHGRTVYELRYSFAAAKAIIENASSDEVAQAFVDYALQADLTPVELEILRDIAHNRANIGKRSLDKMLKYAREKQRTQRVEAERQHRIAERQDPRPQIPVPMPDAEWLPQMAIINDVLGASTALEPPMRDVENIAATVSVRRMPFCHLLTSAGSNSQECKDDRLPAPEQPLIIRLSETELAEVIEQHIEYIAESRDGERSVHLPAPFVKHYWKRADNRLPTVSGIATMPIVLPDGGILAGEGLDRDRGIVFRIPSQLLKLLPKPKECTPAAIVNAMIFLTDEWLIDVLTTYQGKSTLIAEAMTIMERLALPERPAFNITSSRRGGGKTTVLHMISMAVLGHRATAAAWSHSEEERRKALFAYLASGVAHIVWDNIPLGTAISCPSIEKALTADTYQDRILGETDTRIVPAHTIQSFTGNNIGIRGDLRSRVLDARINVTQVDPENREFKHPDPIAWTEAHRCKILRALFIILLGNPRFKQGSEAPQAPTRFKMWWHLVGSAVEHAAQLVAESDAAFISDRNASCPAQKISFKDIFSEGDKDEEQDSSLVTVLRIIRNQWPSGTDPATIAKFINDKIRDPQSIYDNWIPNPAGTELKDAIVAASGKKMDNVSATTLTWKLKAIQDTPAEVDGKLLALRYVADRYKPTVSVNPVA